jgi:CheY-like chemotaxis protein
MLWQEENTSFSQQVDMIHPRPASAASPRAQVRPRSGAQHVTPSFEPLLIIIDDYLPSQRLLAELSAHVGLRPTVCSTLQGMVDLFAHELVVGIVLDKDNHSIGTRDIADALQQAAAPNMSSPIISLASSPVYATRQADDSHHVSAHLPKPICVADFFSIFEQLFVPRLDALRLICQYRMTQPMAREAFAVL